MALLREKRDGFASSSVKTCSIKNSPVLGRKAHGKREKQKRLGSEIVEKGRKKVEEDFTDTAMSIKRGGVVVGVVSKPPKKKKNMGKKDLRMKLKGPKRIKRL